MIFFTVTHQSIHSLKRASLSTWWDSTVGLQVLQKKKQSLKARFPKQSQEGCGKHNNSTLGRMDTGPSCVQASITVATILQPERGKAKHHMEQLSVMALKRDWIISMIMEVLSMPISWIE